MIFVFRNHILFGFSHIFLNDNVKFHICFLMINMQYYIVFQQCFNDD